MIISRYNNEEIKKLAKGDRILLISEKKLKELEVDLSFSNRKWVSDTDISIATIGVLEPQDIDD